MKRIAVAALGLFLVAALAGCSDGMGAVNGTVSLDGQPVADGSITFVRSDGDLAREGAPIKNGSFSARLRPGKYKIELTGKKVVGKRKQKGMSGEEEELEITEELFPERFNTKTELSEEIKAGTNALNLDLKTKK